MKKQLTAAFAKALAELGAQGEKTEDLASSLLRIIKEQMVRTIEDLDAVITAAYDLNGWNTRQGRPTVEKRAKVPNTVRTYMWELRSAVKDGVPVWNFKTFYEVRLARKKAKVVAKPVVADDGRVNVLPDLPELDGVRISHGDAPTGSLFHDLILLFVTIPDEQRVLLERNLSRLLHKYQVAAPAVVAPVKRKATG